MFLQSCSWLFLLSFPFPRKCISLEQGCVHFELSAVLTPNSNTFAGCVLSFHLWRTLNQEAPETQATETSSLSTWSLLRPAGRWGWSQATAQPWPPAHKSFG